LTLDLVITNARLADRQGSWSIGIADGRIAAIAPTLEAAAPSHDAEGHLVTPGLVDCHIHLDKAHLTERCPIEAGTLEEAIRRVAEAKAAFTAEDVHARASAVVRSAMAAGTMAMQSYVEVDPRAGLRSFEALAQLQRDVAPCLDLRLCAFAQEGLTNEPATLELLEQALAAGAEAVGGCPYTDPEPETHVRLIFDLAERFAVPADFHLDFDLDATAMTLPYVIAETRRRGFAGRVAVGHVTKLSAAPPDVVARLAAELAGAGIAVVALPATDLFINGRAHDHLVPRGVAPLAALAAAGVTVAIGTNNVMNPFTPYGDASLLRLANLFANAAQLGRPRDLALAFATITTGPAKVLDRPWGLDVGAAADLIEIDAPDPMTAVATPAQCLAGWKAGRQTFEHRPATLLGPAASLAVTAN
jgi:cytosine/creatinine deaminase